MIFLLDPVWFDARNASIRRVGSPMMMHALNLDRADLMLVIEFFPSGLDLGNVVLLLDFERIPTAKKYMFGASMRDNTSTVTWNHKGGRLTMLITIITRLALYQIII